MEDLPSSPLSPAPSPLFTPDTIRRFIHGESLESPKEENEKSESEAGSTNSDLQQLEQSKTSKSKRRLFSESGAAQSTNGPKSLRYSARRAPKDVPHEQQIIPASPNVWEESYNGLEDDELQGATVPEFARQGQSVSSRRRLALNSNGQEHQLPIKTSSVSPQLRTDTESNTGESTRPSRKRSAPMNFENHVRAVSSSPTPASRDTKRKQPLRGNWTANHLVTSTKSKLATINLSDLLSNDRAWDELTRDQQVQLISMLPNNPLPQVLPDTPIPNVAKAFLKGNSSFQADVRLFQEDLAAGRYDPIWLKDAHKASERRAAGDFDSWKEKNRETFWGQKQRVDYTALAGDSSLHDLPTLVASGYFQVGDVWLLQRGYRPGGGEKGFTVEKEATVCLVSPKMHALPLTDYCV